MAATAADTLDLGERAAAAEGYTWKPLQLLNVYRLALAILALLVAYSENLTLLLGRENPTLFFATSLFYFGFGLLCIFTLGTRRPAFLAQVCITAAVDITVITLLTHASGGVASGLGMLLIVTVAGTSALVPGRIGVLFAAVATLAVLGEEAYGEIQGRSRQPLYTQAGILGGTYFATAVAAYLLARRLRESEALAEQRGLDLANMAQLNDYIIQHMQAGLVVIDPQVRIRLINDSAWYLLGMPAGGKDKRLEDVSPELAERFQAWEETESDAHVTLHPRHGPGAVMARFERLGQDAGDSVLILLEDASVTTQQMQQMKLASLGRLTASIAHEIRNPLGAISHAAQLLDEGEDTGQANRRLAEIIRNHTHRMNEIIENVLQLSRRRDSQPQVFALRPWLEDFIETFCSGQSVRPEEIALEVEPANVEVRMDPSHLHQVLWNLCQNALEHAPAPPGSTRLRVRAGRMPGTRGDFLEVIDAGPGVTPEQVEEIFEPFYTTAASGTGLGLYIARELCECNRARIEYVPVPSGGSCFRIWFPELPRQVA